MKNEYTKADLEAQNNQLNKRIAELETTVSELTALVEHFKELFKLSQQKRFGASSEKTSLSSSQMSLFDDEQRELHEIADSEQSKPLETETEQISYIRRRSGKRQEDLSKLPLEIVEHDIPESERKCSVCGEIMNEFGVETRDEIKIIPPQVIHVQHRIKVYKCDNCDKNDTQTPIIKASLPKSVIKGSVASASAIAYIMTQKHLMHLPLYRLEQDFKRQGVFINRQNMANWVIYVCENWLKKIYDKLRLNLLEHDVLHADETTLQVLNEPGKSPQSKSYMWEYRTSGEAKSSIVFYEYHSNRGGENAKNFLKGFCGFCHTDGYAGYHNIKNVTIVGCWAHVRRKFDEAFKIAKMPDSPAKIGLNYCNKLFALEHDFENLIPQERFTKRQELSKPLTDEFFEWAKTVRVPPNLAISRAITYLLNQREYLSNVFLDGRLELSNNRAERSIKPFVMGRKNWLFCNSVNGAKASAITFSIIETAKENGLKPFEYLTFLLESLPNIKSEHIDELLPWSDSIPKTCLMLC